VTLDELKRIIRVQYRTRLHPLQFFQCRTSQPGGGFDRNVGDEDIMWQKICFIRQNPVERGLVEKPEDWKWSSARWYAGQREGQIPIDYEKGRREWNVPPRWLDDGKRIERWRP